MDRKTKINTIISIVLVTLIAGLAYWAQIPTKDLKAELIDTDTVLVRIQDFAFDPDIVRIDEETTVSWLHDDEINSDVQNAVVSYDPSDISLEGEEFESDLMTLGDTFSHTFNDAGVYYYKCKLHPFMTGKVCVGDESEEIDEDCAIDTGLGDEEELVDEDEDTLTDEDEDTLLVDEDEDLLDEDEDTLLDDEDEDLLPAADEDFDTSVVDDMDDMDDEEDDDDDTTVIVVPQEPVTTTTAAQTTQTATQDELASSGPEDAIYLLVALFALYMGRKLAGNQA